MKKEDFEKQIKEAMTHPDNWEELSDKEKDALAFERTMLVSELSRKQLDARLREKIIKSYEGQWAELFEEVEQEKKATPQEYTYAINMLVQKLLDEEKYEALEGLNRYRKKIKH